MAVVGSRSVYAMSCPLANERRLVMWKLLVKIVIVIISDLWLNKRK
jgi:hypothetical protein